MYSHMYSFHLFFIFVFTDKVIWKRLYNTSSLLDKGSLYQLRNAIDRRNVSASVENDFNSSEDFFILVVKSHIVASAMQYLECKVFLMYPYTVS